MEAAGGIRRRLGRGWLVASFGAAWLASQTAILVLLSPIAPGLWRLQTRVSSAEETLAILQGWEERGVLGAYRAHFVLDDFHWLLYAGFFTTLLCRLFEARRVPRRWNFVLALPLVSGLLDVVENALQRRFIASPGFPDVVDPLPLFSLLASGGKWLLVAGYASLSGVLLLRLATGRRRSAPAG